MRGTVLYGPRDVRFEEREVPKNHQADGRHYQDLIGMRVRI